MKNKFLVNKLLQNTQNPQGFLGKMILFGYVDQKGKECIEGKSLLRKRP